MIDIRTLRENPEAVRASQQARGDDPALVDTILAADEKRRASQQAFEDLRAQQKNLSRTVGKAFQKNAQLFWRRPRICLTK